MRTLWIVFCIALVAATAHAQQRRERAGVSATIEARADLDGQPGETLSLSEWEVSSGYPVLRRNESTLVLGVRYVRSEFDIESSRIDGFTAHALNVPLRYSYRGMTNWLWLASLGPGLHTDFDGVTADDLRATALLIGTRTLSPSLSVSGGLVYNQDFGRSRVFPAIGAVWKPDETWRVEALMPRPRVVYTPSSRLDLYGVIEPSGDSWNVRLDGETRNVGLEEWRAGAGVEWRITGTLALFAQAGWVFDREIEIRERRDKLDGIGIDDTWYARAGLKMF